jgi:hypothetical protein
MNKPTVVLKSLKTFIGMEGHGFNVDVWINGVKCMLAIDSAQGGCYEYQSYGYKNPKGLQIEANTKLLEDYIASLPESPLMIGDEPYERDGKVVMMKPDMDGFINDLVIALEVAKEEKKTLNLMKRAILVGMPNSKEYAYYNYKKALSTVPSPILQGHIDGYRAKLKKGEVILNTNLAELGVK